MEIPRERGAAKAKVLIKYPYLPTEGQWKFPRERGAAKAKVLIKYPYLPHGRVMEIPRERRMAKAKVLIKEKSTGLCSGGARSSPATYFCLWATRKY